VNDLNRNNVKIWQRGAVVGRQRTWRVTAWVVPRALQSSAVKAVTQFAGGGGGCMQRRASASVAAAICLSGVDDRTDDGSIRCPVGFQRILYCTTTNGRLWWTSKMADFIRRTPWLSGNVRESNEELIITA